MHELKSLLMSNVISGLKRKAVNKPSRWAETYRKMGQPYPGLWTFKYHPWTRQMHDTDAQLVVGQKSAQMGYTETALNKTFYNIDIIGNSCLYVLPALMPDARDFSTARFDAALELSDHLRNLFSDVKNVGLKRAGNAVLYVRGSRSRNQLKSLPVAFIVLDEVDEMKQENIPLAFERAAGQVTHQVYMLSTPTINKVGINVYFEASNQNHFLFTCPKCSKYTELLYPESFILTGDSLTDPMLKDSHIICKECKSPLDHKDKVNFLSSGIWIPSFSNRDTDGYYINQLYSTTVTPYDIAKAVIKARENLADEQELYNSKLGLAHNVQGSSICDTEIVSCKKDYSTYTTKPKDGTSLIVMGVDVGRFLHYEIAQVFITHPGTGTTDLSARTTFKVLCAGKVAEFENLDYLIKEFGVISTVCDAQPEKRKALEFAQRNKNVRLCYYSNSATAQNITENQERYTVHVDRTSWLDASLGRFRNNRILLPRDINQEYVDHIKALVRIYQKNNLGENVGSYTNVDHDHFAHAHNYAEIALHIAVLGDSGSLSQVV